MCSTLQAAARAAYAPLLNARTEAKATFGRNAVRTPVLCATRARDTTATACSHTWSTCQRDAGAKGGSAGVGVATSLVTHVPRGGCQRNTRKGVLHGYGSMKRTCTCRVSGRRARTASCLNILSELEKQGLTVGSAQCSVCGLREPIADDHTADF